jgi:uncharacterized membrane protein YphA (DoxX/SURF4 family)
MNKKLIQRLAILCFFAMFIYSGIMKIKGFDKKTNGLQKKTGLPFIINQLGMTGVILLEIFGSLLIVLYFFDNPLNMKIVNKDIIKLVCLIYMLFMIVVTFLYHPPQDKMIPFLSNVTTFGGLLLIYNNI